MFSSDNKTIVNLTTYIDKWQYGLIGTDLFRQ